MNAPELEKVIKNFPLDVANWIRTNSDNLALIPDGLLESAFALAKDGLTEEAEYIVYSSMSDEEKLQYADLMIKRLKAKVNAHIAAKAALISGLNILKTAGAAIVHAAIGDLTGALKTIANNAANKIEGKE